MSVILTRFIAGLVRVTLLSAGLIALSLSLFHGFDLNLLFFVALSMFAAAGIPYVNTSAIFRMSGIIVSSLALLLCAYLVFEILQSSYPERSIGAWDAVFLMPLFCLIYLLVYFSKGKVENFEQR